MKVHLDQAFPFPAGETAAAFTDPALYPWFAKLPKLGVPEVLSRQVQGDKVLLRIRHRFAGELGAAARAVLEPARLTWVEESEHDLARRTVQLRLRPDHYADRFQGSGTYRFVDVPGGCTRSIDVEVKVRVPFVGRTVEQAIVSGLREHLGDEVTIVTAYLRGKAQAPS